MAQIPKARATTMENSAETIVLKVIYRKTLSHE
jgi:hypothetical protein